MRLHDAGPPHPHAWAAPLTFWLPAGPASARLLAILSRADLLQRVHAANRAAQEEEAQHRYGRGGGGGAGGSGRGRAAPGAGAGAELAGGGSVRDINVDLITLIMSELEKEHEFL